MILGSVQLFLLTLLIIGLVVGFIFYVRSTISGAAKKGDTTLSTPFAKKFDFADVLKNRTSSYLLGGLLSIAFISLAFNYTVYKGEEAPVVEEASFGDFEIADIPDTEEVVEIEEIEIEIEEVEVEVEIELVEVEKKPEEVKKKVEEPKKIVAKPTKSTSGAGEKKSAVVKKKAPVKKPKVEEDNKVYTKVDQKALFSSSCSSQSSKATKSRCSNKALTTYISNSLSYPTIAEDQQLEGTPFIEFVVDKQGKMSGVKLAKSSGQKILDNAALKFVKNKMAADSKWVPAMMGTKVVKQKIRIPIVFRLS